MFVCIYTCMPVCMCGCAYCFTYLRHSYLYRQGRWLGRQKQQLYKHEFLSSEPQHPHKVKVCLEPSALSHLQRSGWGLRSSLASTSNGRSYLTETRWKTRGRQPLSSSGLCEHVIHIYTYTTDTQSQFLRCHITFMLFFSQYFQFILYITNGIVLFQRFYLVFKILRLIPKYLPKITMEKE